MSAVLTDGRQAEIPCDAGRFLLKIQREWAGSRPQRVRALAALTLHANGWTCEQIALALGWEAKGHVARLIKQTKAELQEFYRARGGAEPAELDLSLQNATAAEAAIEILRQHPRGLTFRQIHDLAAQRGLLWERDTLRRDLARRPDQFERVGPGLYRLARRQPGRDVDPSGFSPPG